MSQVFISYGYLAEALCHQGKKSEALPHAQRAVEIFTRLGSPILSKVRKTLLNCEQP